MIEGQGPVVQVAFQRITDVKCTLFQALLGTFFTWFVTLAGACMAVFLEVSCVHMNCTSEYLIDISQGDQRPLLDSSLGFAAGVMLAASYWSLLEPALLIAEELHTWPVLPLAVGLVAGAGFVGAADSYIGEGVTDVLQVRGEGREEEDSEMGRGVEVVDKCDSEDTGLRQRVKTDTTVRVMNNIPESRSKPGLSKASWRRLVLMILAVTVHNFPEGLAVGVGFGAIGSNPQSTFSAARSLALAIGLQNFPEGLAVALPLKAAGFSNKEAIWLVLASF